MNKKLNWIWRCICSNGASSWKDSDQCLAMSKKPTTELNAERSGSNHLSRCHPWGGAHISIEKVDLRRWRKKG